MTMTDIKITERLCLSKEDDIYVDHSNLMEHQIEGLRFLYTQYKKKLPGVILNDPSGYGKTVVVAVFLKALRRLLTAPALLLCRAAELEHWRQHLQQWGDTDDVIFEASNPYLKKPLFVNTPQHLTSLSRRSWSVAVVDDDMPRDVQADFKIFLTPHDMKENLFTFSTIYKWLYPKEDFDVNFFTPNKNDLADVQKKSVLVDYFFELVVFRSKNFTPFKKPETQPPIIIIEPPRISLKNKDATGTKIKRSKARIEAEANHAAKIPRTEPPERNATITSKDYYKDKEMDVESFIRNEKPITGDGVEVFMDFQTMMRADTNDKGLDVVNKENNLNGNLNINDDCLTDVCTADYQDAINEIVNNENDKSIDEGDMVEETGDVVNTDIGTEGDKETIDVSKDIVSVLDETKDVTIQDVNKGSKNDLEAKLIELEEKTLNKFKGSLLDSIF